MILKHGPKILVAISGVVLFVGFIVMVGWFAGSDFIVRIHPDLPSTKFITALLFFLCGFQLFFAKKIFIDSKDSYYSWLVVFSVITICLILLCAAIVINPGIGYILDSLPRETHYDMWSRIPYMPSIMSLAVFLIIAIVRLCLFSHYTRALKALRVVGWGVLIIALLALVGNVFGIQTLFYVTKYSGGMALVTSILFILIGIYYIIFTSILRTKK
jgi:hypothetical protein